MGLYYNSAQVWGCLVAISYPPVLWNPQCRSHRGPAYSYQQRRVSFSKGSFSPLPPFPPPSDMPVKVSSSDLPVPAHAGLRSWLFSSSVLVTAAVRNQQPLSENDSLNQSRTSQSEHCCLHVLCCCEVGRLQAAPPHWRQQQRSVPLQHREYSASVTAPRLRLHKWVCISSAQADA